MTILIKRIFYILEFFGSSLVRPWFLLGLLPGGYKVSTKQDNLNICTILFQIFFQSLIYVADGEAHDVEVGAFHAGDAYITDPLLNTIGTSFV